MTNEQANEQAAFHEGWHAGALGIAAETPRQVAETHPTFSDGEITCYLNGAEDGARGDRTRLYGC